MGCTTSTTPGMATPGMDLTMENSVGGFSPLAAPPDAAPVLLKNALVPRAVPGNYERLDVLLSAGLIAKMVPAGSLTLGECPAGTVEEDATERLLMPGMVNGHTHSVEHWARGQGWPRFIFVDMAAIRDCWFHGPGGFTRSRSTQKWGARLALSESRAGVHRPSCARPSSLSRVSANPPPRSRSGT
jgi:cytosine/adenosine deaminase-related metal-dependent hydrolase